MEKINFSGGEPFLHNKGEFVGKLVQYCKQDLQLPSVSIVSNGSMIKEEWFQKYGNVAKLLTASFLWVHSSCAIYHKIIYIYDLFHFNFLF